MKKLKKTQEQIVRQERLRALSEMASGIAVAASYEVATQVKPGSQGPAAGWQKGRAALIRGHG